MDIQKEREEFEQAVKESCGLSPESVFELGPTGEYKSDVTYFGWFMWLQAKRKIQAVPEGFVLVPKKELQEVLANASDAMGDEKNSHVYLTTGEPSTWFDHFTVAENAVLEAIKDREQRQRRAFKVLWL